MVKQNGNLIILLAVILIMEKNSFDSMEGFLAVIKVIFIWISLYHNNFIQEISITKVSTKSSILDQL